MVIRAVVLAFLLSLLLATPTSGQFASWAFEAPIVVQSVNEDAVLTNHWVAIEGVDPRALHTQSFMRSDAADLRMATALGEEIPVFAQGLNGEDVTWWFRAPIISRHPTTYFMQLGNPTASNSQSLGIAERDMVVVKDDVSLDITESLMLESDGTRVDELVDETTWLIQKPGAYGLGIRPSGNALEVFGEIVTGGSASVVTDHTAASVPTAKGSLTSPSVETEGCADASKYNCVDDPVGVPDVETYLHTADGSSNTVHTGSALPEGNGARGSNRIVANGCTSTSKWQCVNDATNRPDTSTYLSTVDNSTDVDDEEHLLPNSNGDRASTSISTRGCTAGSKWQCVNDSVNNPDDGTSYLFTEGLVTADSPNMVPDSNGDETDTSIRARMLLQQIQMGLRGRPRQHA